MRRRRDYFPFGCPFSLSSPSRSPLSAFRFPLCLSHRRPSLPAPSSWPGLLAAGRIAHSFKHVTGSSKFVGSLEVAAHGGGEPVRPLRFADQPVAPCLDQVPPGIGRGRLAPDLLPGLAAEQPAPIPAVPSEPGHQLLPPASSVASADAHVHPVGPLQLCEGILRESVAMGRQKRVGITSPEIAGLQDSAFPQGVSSGFSVKVFHASSYRDARYRAKRHAGLANLAPSCHYPAA